MKATFKNCYGLEDFTLEEIKFDAQNSKAIIYAPNGVMKSSFSKVLDDISRKKKTVDRIFTERKSSYTVEYYSATYSDAKKLKKNEQPNIYVINSFDEKFEAYSDSVATILADDEIRKKYDTIHGAYSVEIDSLINVFKSHTSFKEEEIRTQICNDFGLTIDADWEVIIERLVEAQAEVTSHGEFAEIKYDQLFNSYTEKILNDPVFQEKIQQYIETYGELVKRSKLLSLQFDDYNASEFGKTIEKTKLFSANHKIVLSNGTEISDIASLHAVIQKEIQQINDTPELSSIHASISKMINGNVASRVLKDLIKENRGIIKYLSNISKVKKSIWMTYLSAESFDIDALSTSIKTKKKEIDALLVEVDKQQAQWERVVDVFKKRFHAPFKVDIQNPRRVVLNDEPARLTFTYVRGTDSRQKTKEELMECLSVGEKRALYLLQVLFDLERIKDIADKTGQKQLVIADDIADSFDYSNKYAIIEYLSELSNNKMIDLLILTHNFDFYRTISSRLDIKYSMCFVAQKEADGRITMSNFQYKKDFFNVGIIDKIRPGNLSIEELLRTFISAIPFCRNVCEYTANNSWRDFLTGILHVKLNTDTVTIADCWAQLKNDFSLNDLSGSCSTDKWIDAVYKAADNICNETATGVSLINKITLSIAIRLKAEFFLRDVLVSNGIDIMCANSQTREWANRANACRLSDKDKAVISDVLLITPESIHVNAFMYEPLIDIPNYQLTDLYQSCKGLGML